MVQTVAEVPESQAEGKIKAAYDDIKDTLRLPRVPHVFRALATQPDYFTLAWSALKPNAQTMYFERRSDALRSLAVVLSGSLGDAPAVHEGALRALQVQHYAAPKVLLAIAALHSATNGSQPVMQHLSDEEKRQVARGVPKAASAVAEQPSDTNVAPELAQMDEKSPGLTAELSYLSGTPEYLGSAWAAFEPLVASPGVNRVGRELRWALESAVTALPFRMDLSSHALLQGGLSQADIDDVRDTLNAGFGSASAALVMTAFLAAGLGRETAGQSPFPV